MIGSIRNLRGEELKGKKWQLVNGEKETDLPIEFGAAFDVETAPLFSHYATPFAGCCVRSVVAIFAAVIATSAGVTHSVVVVVSGRLLVSHMCSSSTAFH